jgi:hypothetical protein
MAGLQDHTHDARAKRLYGVFMRTVKGEQQVSNGQQASLYLEAICSQPEQARCVNRIISSTSGLPALQSALRINLTRPFVNTRFKDLLMYLSAPEIKQISGGDFLNKLLVAITDPPIIWNVLVELARKNELDEDTLEGFAWLLLELISLPASETEQFHHVAQDTALQQTLLAASRLSTRSYGHKIVHIMRTIKVPTDESFEEDTITIMSTSEISPYYRPRTRWSLQSLRTYD